MAFGASTAKSLASIPEAVIRAKPKLVVVYALHRQAAGTTTLRALVLETEEEYRKLSTDKNYTTLDDGLRPALQPETERGNALVCGSPRVVARAT